MNIGSVTRITGGYDPGLCFLTSLAEAETGPQDCSREIPGLKEVCKFRTFHIAVGVASPKDAACALTLELNVRRSTVQNIAMDSHYRRLTTVAVMGTSSGPPRALVLMTKVAVSVDAASAKNFTAIVQLLPTPSSPSQ